MDLVRPLALAGIRCAVVAQAGAPTRYSRATREIIDWIDPWTEPEALVDRLLEFASRQLELPVLYYEEDRDLLLVSRHRDRLSQSFRFVVAGREMVEDLVDKGRFQELAARRGLPVPASRRFRAESAFGAAHIGLAYPLVIKPITRRGFHRWSRIAHSGKALAVHSSDELARLWPDLIDLRSELLAQELVPGPETRIVSYHLFASESGETLAEFTGRKIRTRPAEYGFTTALEITDESDVVELGREVITMLQLTGVAKLDFKRDDQGHLHLLEVNPRFTLWHHAAAKAGVNIPALVYSYLTARPRPPTTRARPGVRWCYHVHDGLAARDQAVPLHRWISWAARCEAISAFAVDDPLPLVRGVFLNRLRKIFGRLGKRR